MYPQLITTLLFDHDPQDPSSLDVIRDTLSVLATSAQHEQDEEDQHLFEQRLLVSDHAFPDGEHTDESRPGWHTARLP